MVPWDYLRAGPRLKQQHTRTHVASRIWTELSSALWNGYGGSHPVSPLPVVVLWEQDILQTFIKWPIQWLHSGRVCRGGNLAFLVLIPWGLSSNHMGWWYRFKQNSGISKMLYRTSETIRTMGAECPCPAGGSLKTPKSFIECCGSRFLSMEVTHFHSFSYLFKL